MVSRLICSGSWCIPVLNCRRNHIGSKFLHWLTSFVVPTVDLTKQDFISWDSVNLSKLKTFTVWSSIRAVGPAVGWDQAVWHRLRVPRFAFMSWLLCLGRLSTKVRLANFGLDVNTACLFCVGGSENAEHLFLRCPYSSYVLERLLNKMQIIIDWPTINCWKDLLNRVEATASSGIRHLALLGLSVFSYHLWRERNLRDHNKGCFHPNNLLDGVLLDTQIRLGTSSWFLKMCNKDSSLAAWIL